MLTVFDLDEFVDKLGDLTRATDPMDIVVEATGLLSDNQAQRFLMQQRAAAAADAHFLHGVPLRRIARAAGKTSQTVRNWLDEYGPKHYLTMAYEGLYSRTDPSVPRLTLRLMTVDSDDQLMKRKIREQRAAGRRLVPASLNLVDPEQMDGIAAQVHWPMKPEELWEQLGG